MPENARAVQPRRPPPAPEPIALDVLYEDEWLIVVDKPAGMVVHPTYRNWSGTLLNGLLWYFSPGPEGPGLRDVALACAVRRGQPRIVTRLDKDTSGVVLVALSAEVHKQIQRDTAAGRVKKEYLAIVRGVPVPPRGAIEAPLARSSADRRRVVIDGAGRQSRTTYEVVSADESVALVRCELETGRTHQIRVHLASRGWPILGDVVYGEPCDRLPRQALHAWRVTLLHPVTREMLTIEAPLPADLRAVTRAPAGGTAAGKQPRR